MKIKKGYILGAVFIAILCAVAIYSYNTYHFKKASRDILYQLSNQLIVKQGLSEKMSTHLIFDTLYVDGNISKNDDKIIASIIEKNLIPVQTISINSGGGDIETAINIGRIIHDKGISIEVRRLCLSSCANYLFPAAKNKVINYGSIIGFHGSPNSDDSKLITTVDGERTSDPATTDKIFAEIRKTDKAFYNNIHVSWMMPLCGQKENIGDPDTGLSTYSEKDFTQFGVKNISYTDGEMVWKKSMDIMGIPFCSLLQGKLIMRELNENELSHVSGAGMWGSIGNAIGGMFGGSSAGCNGSYSHTSTTNKDGSHSESTSFSGGCSVNAGGKSGGSSKGNGGSKNGGGHNTDHGKH